MQSPFYFIAKPINGKRYDNTRDIGGIELIVSTSEEDHKFSNRYAEVVEVPIGYTGPIEKGNILLVHHNVFKFYNDMKGRQKSGKSFFTDDLFFIDEDQFFLFKKDGEWNTHSKYCFVKPIPMKDSFIDKSVKEEPLMGTMRYINDNLLSLGVKVGDEVCFTPESEYEFTVEGEKLYRVFDHQITIVL